MNEKTIVFLPAATGQAAPWRKLSADGHVTDRGEMAADALEAISGECVLVVPATDVAVRWLTLQQGNVAQQIALARWKMAEVLGHDLADDEVIVGQASQTGFVPVAAVRRSLLAAWQSWIDSAGLHVVAVVPAQLCAPIEENIVHAVQMPAGDIIVSATNLSVAAVPEWLDDLAEGRDVSWTSTEQSLDFLSAGAATANLNLLGRTVSRTGRTIGWKTLAALAAVLCLSPVWIGLADVAHNRWMQDRADRLAITQAVAFMPELAGQDNVLEQAENRLAGSPPLGSYVKTLAVLVGVLETVSGTASEVSGENGELRGVLRLGTAEDTGPIRDGLLRHGLEFRGCEPVNENGQSVCTFVIGAV